MKGQLDPGLTESFFHKCTILVILSSEKNILVININIEYINLEAYPVFYMHHLDRQDSTYRENTTRVPVGDDLSYNEWFLKRI